MRQGYRALLLLLLGACSRSDFSAAEAQFVDSLNYLELIHQLLIGVNSDQSLKEAEQKIPLLIADFDRIRRSTESISYQLQRRLQDRYEHRLKVAWIGIETQLRRLRPAFNSPMLLKLDEWLAKMMLNE